MWVRGSDLCNNLLSVKVITAHHASVVFLTITSLNLYPCSCFTELGPWKSNWRLEQVIPDDKIKENQLCFHQTSWSCSVILKWLILEFTLITLIQLPWKQCFRELNPIMLKSVSLPLSLSLSHTHHLYKEEKKPWRKYNKCLHWWDSDGRTMDDFLFPLNFFYISQFFSWPSTTFIGKTENNQSTYLKAESVVDKGQAHCSSRS